MGYLGFDRDRLATLSGAIGQALIDIGAQRSTDAAAGEAVAALDAAVTTLQPWGSTIRALLGNACLANYTPVTLQPLDFANAALYEQQTGAGWTVLTDLNADLPLSEEEQAMQATALGHELRDPSVLSNLDTMRRAQLQTELDRIKQSKPASKAFIDALGDDGLVNVTDALARKHNPAAADGKLDAASVQVEQMLGTIGAIMNNRRSDPTDPVAPVVLHLDPVAAAFIVRQMDIDAVQLGKLTNELLKRWLFSSPAEDGRTDGSFAWSQSPENTAGGPGDILIAHVLTVPGASTAYVETAIDNGPRVLFGSVSRPVFERLMIDSVDPSHASSEQAKHITLTLFDLQRTNRNQPDYIDATMVNIADRSYLGEMVAPWIMQFTGANHPQLADDRWNVDLKTGFLNLTVMMADETSSAYLDNQTAAWIESIKSRSWDHISAPLSDFLRLLSALRNARLHAEISGQAASDNGKQEAVDVLFTALDLIDPSAGIELVFATVRKWADHAVTSDGPDALRRKSAYALDGKLAATAYTIAQQLYANALPKGPVADPNPPPPPPAPDTTVKTGLSTIYSNALLAWANSLPPTAAGEVGQMVLLVLNPTAMSDLIADESA